MQALYSSQKLIQNESQKYQSGWPKSRTLTTSNSSRDVEQQELSFTSGRNRNGTITFEDSYFLTKLNILSPYDPTVKLLGTYPKELKTYVHTEPCRAVYSSFIHNCRKLEQIKICFGRWMDKLVHPDSIILFSAKI